MLSDDVIQFLQSCGGGMLCTRNADNQPAACEILYAELAADRLVGFVPAHLGTHLPLFLADSAAASCVSSRTHGDHRSVQVKGTVAELADPKVYDRAEYGELPFNMDQYYPQFPAEQVHQLIAHLMEHPAFRIGIEVTELYDQTPGPRAGSPIGAQA